VYRRLAQLGAAALETILGVIMAALPLCSMLALQIVRDFALQLLPFEKNTKELLDIMF